MLTPASVNTSLDFEESAITRLIKIHMKNEGKRREKLLQSYKPYQNSINSRFQANRYKELKQAGIIPIDSDSKAQQFARVALNQIHKKRVESLEFVRKNRKAKDVLVGPAWSLQQHILNKPDSQLKSFVLHPNVRDLLEQSDKGSSRHSS